MAPVRAWYDYCILCDSTLHVVVEHRSFIARALLLLVVARRGRRGRESLFDHPFRRRRLSKTSTRTRAR